MGIFQKVQVAVVLIGVAAIAALFYNEQQVEEQEQQAVVESEASAVSEMQLKEDAPLKMAVFPRRFANVTREAFTPLTEYLSKELGREVELIVPLDFNAFWEGVESKEYDLVHYNQYHYVKSHKELGYEVIAANEEFGSRTIAGTLFVKADNDRVKSVEDLRGKNIIFGGGKRAMGSYIGPTAILRKHGLQEGDYTEVFAKNPPQALLNIDLGVAEAAAAGDALIKSKAVTSKIDVNTVAVLAKSEDLTQLPWAVRGDMPVAQREKLRELMTTLKQQEGGEAILKAAKVTDFFAVENADYDKTREVTMYVLGEEY